MSVSVIKSLAKNDTPTMHYINVPMIHHFVLHQKQHVINAVARLLQKKNVWYTKLPVVDIEVRLAVEEKVANVHVHLVELTIRGVVDRWRRLWVVEEVIQSTMVGLPLKVLEEAAEEEVETEHLLAVHCVVETAA